MEDGALAQLSFGPDFASVAGDDALADGEAESGAWVFVAVESLEETENALGVLLIETYSVVGNRNRPFGAVVFS